ncbi:MAG: transposase [Saccharofermentanales bacterium]
MKKRKFTPEYKAKIVLELLKEEKQLNEIAARENINPNQLRTWRKEFLENAPRVFTGNKDEREQKQKATELQDERQELMAKVGQLTIEVDWLKKKSIEVYGPEYEKKFSKRPF